MDFSDLYGSAGFAGASSSVKKSRELLLDDTNKGRKKEKTKMKKEVRTLVTIGLSTILAMGTMTTAFAAGWTEEGQGSKKWRYETENGTQVINQWKQIDGKWYYFDTTGYMGTGWTKVDGKWYFLGDSGAMAENGEWEGGYITADGSLNIDEIAGIDGNFVYYRWPTNQHYEGTMEWKSQFLKQIIQRIDENPSSSSLAMDFQLPANWKDICPKPLITYTITCAIVNSDRYIYNPFVYDYNWQVDENNCIHISGTFSEEN